MKTVPATDKVVDMLNNEDCSSHRQGSGYVKQ